MVWCTDFCYSGNVQPSHDGDNDDDDDDCCAFLCNSILQIYETASSLTIRHINTDNFCNKGRRQKYLLVGWFKIPTFATTY